jgi:uncharacterized RDD family membrane protein YckC
MSTEQDRYIAEVINWIPGKARRAEIAMDLRGHIAERVERGQTRQEALAQLGNPLTLAESYMAAVPLESAPFGKRISAKAFDLVLVIPIAFLAAWGISFWLLPAVVLAYNIYLLAAEYRVGQTLGKHLFGLQVVRESGTRISFGQAVVRQLPTFLQVFVFDAIFVFFTDRRQRAAELLSKTRVVVALQRSTTIGARQNAARLLDGSSTVTWQS